MFMQLNLIGQIYQLCYKYKWRILQTGHGASVKGEHNPLLVVKITVIKGEKILDFDKWLLRVTAWYNAP